MSFTGATLDLFDWILNRISLPADMTGGKRQTIMENGSITDLAAYHQKRWPASGNEYESQTTTDACKHGTHTGRASLGKIFNIW